MIKTTILRNSLIGYLAIATLLFSASFIPLWASAEEEGLIAEFISAEETGINSEGGIRIDFKIRLVPLDADAYIYPVAYHTGNEARGIKYRVEDDSGKRMDSNLFSVAVSSNTKRSGSQMVFEEGDADILNIRFISLNNNSSNKDGVYKIVIEGIYYSVNKNSEPIYFELPAEDFHSDTFVYEVDEGSSTDEVKPADKPDLQRIQELLKLIAMLKLQIEEMKKIKGEDKSVVSPSRPVMPVIKFFSHEYSTGNMVAHLRWSATNAAYCNLFDNTNDSHVSIAKNLKPNASYKYQTGWKDGDDRPIVLELICDSIYQDGKDRVAVSEIKIYPEFSEDHSSDEGGVKDNDDVEPMNPPSTESEDTDTPDEPKIVEKTQPKPVTGLYKGFVNGNLMTERVMTRAQAVDNCLAKRQNVNNRGKSIRCTWKGEVLFTRPAASVKGAETVNIEAVLDQVLDRVRGILLESKV